MNNYFLQSSLKLLTVFLTIGFIFGCAKKEPTLEEVLAEAQQQQMASDIEGAITKLETYNEAHPGHFEVAEALAFAYAANQDTATAAMYFARAAEIDPSQAEYLLLAAQAWNEAGDPAAAISLYQQYLTLRPNDRSARLTLADLHRAQGNRDAALDILQQAYRLQSDGPIQVRIGELYLQAGNLGQAQQWFRSAAEFQDEGRDEALLGMIEVAIKAERYEDAQALLTVLDEEYPNRLENSPIAALRAQFERWESGQRALQEAVETVTVPTSTPAPSTTATIPTPAPAPTRTPPPATEPGTEPTTPTTAEPSAGEVVAAEPPDKEEMVAAVERERAPAPAPEEALEPDAAAAPLALFPTEAAPRPAPIASSQSYAEFVARARAAMAAGQWREATKNFQRALARSSSDPAIWSELSEAQYQLGEVAMAPASASEAARRAPADPRYRLQYLRVAQGYLRPTEYLDAMERARRDFPLNPEFPLVLARSHEDLGNARFARRYYEEFLRLAAPDHAERAAVEQRLRSL